MHWRAEPAGTRQTLSRWREQAEVYEVQKSGYRQVIAESVRHALSDPGHSHLPLCPDYEGDSSKGEPLELRFPVKTGIVMDKPPALAVGCMTLSTPFYASIPLMIEASYFSFFWTIFNAISSHEFSQIN